MIYLAYGLIPELFSISLHGTYVIPTQVDKAVSIQVFSKDYLNFLDDCHLSRLVESSSIPSTVHIKSENYFINPREFFVPLGSLLLWALRREKAWEDYILQYEPRSIISILLRCSSNFSFMSLVYILTHQDLAFA